MTGICGHIPGVTCSNCHPTPSRAVRDADNEKARADFAAAIAAANKAEVQRQLREVLGVGRWSGWRRQREDERDPLEEDDWGDRLGGKGSRWTRRASLWCKESCPCYEGSWELDQIDRFDGPLTFAPKPTQDTTGDDQSASEGESSMEGGDADDAQNAILCPECNHHIHAHDMDGCLHILCCPRTPEDVARALITDAVKAERLKLVEELRSLLPTWRDDSAPLALELLATRWEEK